jgi:hypothetical protein
MNPETHQRRGTNLMSWKFATSCMVLLLAAFTSENAHAERWLQASPADSGVWYDAANVQPTANGLIRVWVSTGPNRTNLRADGMKSYPTYSIVNCRQRTAGSKLSLDSGKALMPYAPNSGMGQLIAKLCS